jgi:threonine/homoserine/homoserine lactone efflux protein
VPIAALFGCAVKLPALSQREVDMFGVTDYPAFVLAVLVFLAIPGPGNLALFSATHVGGFRAGVAATFGVMAGDQVLLWLALAGVAALITHYPEAFTLLQLGGASYLVGVGYIMLKMDLHGLPLLKLHPNRFFVQALVITVLNPKAILFYMAFFPLFIDPAAGQGYLTFGVMALTIAVLTFFYGLVAVSLARRLSDWASHNPEAVQWVNRGTGVMLILFGLKLLLT